MSIVQHSRLKPQRVRFLSTQIETPLLFTSSILVDNIIGGFITNLASTIESNKLLKCSVENWHPTVNDLIKTNRKEHETYRRFILGNPFSPANDVALLLDSPLFGFLLSEVTQAFERARPISSTVDAVEPNIREEQSIDTNKLTRKTLRPFLYSTLNTYPTLGSHKYIHCALDEYVGLARKGFEIQDRIFHTAVHRQHLLTLLNYLGKIPDTAEPPRDTPFVMKEFISAKILDLAFRKRALYATQSALLNVEQKIGDVRNSRIFPDPPSMIEFLRKSLLQYNGRSLIDELSEFHKTSLVAGSELKRISDRFKEAASLSDPAFEAFEQFLFCRTRVLKAIFQTTENGTRFKEDLFSCVNQLVYNDPEALVQLSNTIGLLCPELLGIPTAASSYQGLSMLHPWALAMAFSNMGLGKQISQESIAYVSAQEIRQSITSIEDLQNTLGQDYPQTSVVVPLLKKTKSDLEVFEFNRNKEFLQKEFIVPFEQLLTLQPYRGKLFSENDNTFLRIEAVGISNGVLPTHIANDDMEKASIEDFLHDEGLLKKAVLKIQRFTLQAHYAHTEALPWFRREISLPSVIYQKIMTGELKPAVEAEMPKSLQMLCLNNPVEKPILKGEDGARWDRTSRLYKMAFEGKIFKTPVTSTMLAHAAGIGSVNGLREWCIRNEIDFESLISFAPRGWLPNRTVADSLGIEERVCNKAADILNEQYHRGGQIENFVARNGQLCIHYGPVLIAQLQKKYGNIIIAPHDAITNKRLAREIRRGTETVKAAAEQLKELYPQGIFLARPAPKQQHHTYYSGEFATAIREYLSGAPR